MATTERFACADFDAPPQKLVVGSLEVELEFVLSLRIIGVIGVVGAETNLRSSNEQVSK